ncbi:transposase, partial [Sinorhizobium medicae]|uniref:transposase n=2 Tax=Sinorhizobium medicae TaxID=110321 RepID=UPI001AECFE0E
ELVRYSSVSSFDGPSINLRSPQLKNRWGVDAAYGYGMRVAILGQERRRRWGDAKKLDIVMSIGLDGATATEVAHRHDVGRQQIYAWRHELKKKGLLPSTADTVFVPVETRPPCMAPRSCGRRLRACLQ